MQKLPVKIAVLWGLQLMAEAAAKGRLDLAIQMGELTQKAAEQSRDPVLIKMC